VRRRVAGVAFLMVIAMLVWLAVLLYQKAFTKVVDVTLKADRIGNQLSTQADVKLRGIVVGRVTGVRATAQGAEIRLALDPDQVPKIPSNVSAQLLPKTLFGEKYVELVLPSDPSGRTLRNGDVIPQDRSTTALETERVLNDLFPLLKALRPQELSMTLNALSAALRDRGDRLGGNAVLAAAYLRRLNPSVPQIGADLDGLADLSNNIADASPGLLATLDNLSASSRNLVAERADLDRFLTSTQGFASTARSIVAENEKHLTDLSRDSLPSLSLFARYSPMLSCLLEGLTDYHPVVSDTFGGKLPGLHITLELTQDNMGYSPGQEPKYRDSRPANCWKLPNPQVPEGDDQFDDGYRPEGVDGQHTLASDPALALVAGAAMGIPADQVPDTVSLLLGPLASGNQVGLA
jgi:virulence factor Mce-like protein